MEAVIRVDCPLRKRARRRNRPWEVHRHARETNFSLIMVVLSSALSLSNLAHSSHNLVQALNNNSKIRITIHESKDLLRVLNNQQSTQ
jgi:hypothetical protein